MPKKQNITVNTYIRVGDVEYDVTNKRPEDYPNEVKAALVPLRRLYAQLLVDSNWRQFLEGMPPDIKAIYDTASPAEQNRVFKYWAANMLRNEFGDKE